MEYTIDMSTGRLSKIYQLRLRGMTYQEIGKQLGLSRQRIHQLLTGYKSPTKGLSYNQRRSLRYKNSFRAKNLKTKLQVLTHYGKGKLACVLCGFNNIWALSIDHINGGGHQDIHGTLLYRRLVKENFPEGFQTLCMNCQWIKRHIRHEAANTSKKKI